MHNTPTDVLLQSSLQHWQDNKWRMSVTVIKRLNRITVQVCYIVLYRTLQSLQPKPEQEDTNKPEQEDTNAL